MRIVYDGIRFDAEFRFDPLVEDYVPVELKTMDKLMPHQAQVMTYLKLTGPRLGMLINFTAPLISNGV